MERTPFHPTLDTDISDWLRRRGRECLPPRVLADGARFGPFSVLCLLGRGATAEVCRARREADGAVVALKVPLRSDPGSAERFRREARLLSDHPHPALPRLVASGETGEVPWIALEELSASDLPESSRAVERFLCSLCAGLAHLHALGFVHRDVKPSNVLFRSGGEPVLIDLGYVREADDPASPLADPAPLSVENGRTVGFGTPGFAAPEQFSGAGVSPASDVYALGMLALRCFGGRPPFSWRAVLRRATVPLPADRFPDAAAFARAVRRRRRPFLRLAAAVLAAVAVAAAAISAVALSARRDMLRESGRTRGTLEFAKALLSAANPESAGGASSATVLAAARRAVPAVRAERDPAVRASLALETGRLFESVGSFAEADDLYGVAAAACRRAEPDAGAPGLADVLHRRGVVRRLAGRLDEAETDLREALSLRRAAAAADPADPELSATLQAFGALLSFRNRPEEALAAFRESVGIRRELAARNPDRFAAPLAKALSDCGVQLRELGRCAEAVAAFDEALPVFRAAAPGNGAVGQASLARVLAWRADALRGLGAERFGEALEAFEQALGMLRPLADAEPGTHSLSLARALQNRALLLADAGDADAALAGLDEALAVLREREEAEPGSCASDIDLVLRNRAIVASPGNAEEEPLRASPPSSP